MYLDLPLLLLFRELFAVQRLKTELDGPLDELHSFRDCTVMKESVDTITKSTEVDMCGYEL
jgi:hypothetical protein